MKITTIGPEGLKLISDFEGFSSEPYLCPSSVPTIGIGTTRYFDTKKRVTLNDPPIDHAEAVRLLQGDIDTIYAPLVDKLCRDDLKQHEFDGLCSFIYNAGATYRGKDGKNHYYNLFDHVNNHMPIGELIKYWCKLAVTGNSKVLAGLVRRRKYEAGLFVRAKIK